MLLDLACLNKRVVVVKLPQFKSGQFKQNFCEPEPYGSQSTGDWLVLLIELCDRKCWKKCWKYQKLGGKHKIDIYRKNVTTIKF